MQTLRAKLEYREDFILKIKKVAIPASISLITFLLCNASFLTGFSPLGLAFLSTFSEGLFIYSFLGATVGYFVFLIGRNSLRYLASILLFLGIRLIVNFIMQKKASHFYPLLCGISLFFTGVLTFIYKGIPMDFVLILCEAILATAASFVYKVGMKELIGNSPLSPIGELSVGIILASIYMAILPFNILDVRISKIVACFLILYAAFHMGASHSIIIAVSLGLCGVIQGEPSSLIFFASGGLAAVAFSPGGKIFSTLSFATTALIFGYGSGDIDNFIPVVLEICIGACLALICPTTPLKKLGLNKNSFMGSGELFRKAATEQLLKTSAALSEINDITAKVSKEMERLNGEPLEKYISNAVNHCCRGCKSSPRCWQKEYSKTKEAVSQLFMDSKMGLDLNLSDFVQKTQCENPQKMIDCITLEAKKYHDFTFARGQAYNLRNVVSDQFGGMAELLNSVAQNSLELKGLSEKMSRDISSLLLNNGAPQNSIFAYCDKQQNITVTASFEHHKYKKLDLPQLTAQLSDTTLCSLGPPIEQKKENLTHELTWHTAPCFDVEWDFIQHAANNGRLCGDSVLESSDINGNSIFLLADGMGVGGAAAVDSTMTTSLLSRLLKSGSSFGAALKIVNSSLLSCGEERLCAIDSSILNLTSGNLQIFKAGAAPSFILRDGRCAKIDKSALPAGILGGAKAAKSSLSLKHNDILLMVSDGVTENGEDWISSQLLSLSQCSTNQICSSILSTANDRNLNDRTDDMSVIAIRLKAI